MACLPKEDGQTSVSRILPVLKGWDALNTVRVGPERIKKLRIISIIIIGFGTGALSGLLGIGGGIVLVPAIVYLLGMSQHHAHGTSLAVISFVVLLSAIVYGAHGQVDWMIALILAIGGVVGAIIGAKVCVLLSGRRLRRYFAVFLILIAVRMMVDFFAYGNGVESTTMALPTSGFWGTTLVLAIGVATGMLSGLFGVGGGVIIVPAMVLLLGMSQHMAQGISLAVIIPVSLSGSIMHFRYGNVRLNIWPWLVIGGIAGGFFGARIAIGMDPILLRAMFGGLLLILGGLMLRPSPESSSEQCD